MGSLLPVCTCCCACTVPVLRIVVLPLCLARFEPFSVLLQFRLQCLGDVLRTIFADPF